jgi:hypothetical protein
LKKELLAIVFALRKLHDYLFGRHFTLLTDHRALSYLFTQPRLSPIENNWADILFDYDFDIAHVPGYRNVTPDALSRAYSGQAWGSNDPLRNLSVKRLSISDIATLANKKSPPEDQRQELLEDAHNFGHFGPESVFKRLLMDGYYWSSMRQDCKRLVADCTVCQKYDRQRLAYHPIQSPLAPFPFDHIGIDLLTGLPKTPRGNTVILAVTDRFTKFVVLRALPDKSMTTVADSLWSIIADFGIHKIIQSDNGKEFVNKCMKSLTSRCGIDYRLISAYYPRANGLAERTYRTLLSALRKAVRGNRQNCDAKLPFV